MFRHDDARRLTIVYRDLKYTVKMDTQVGQPKLLPHFLSNSPISY